MRGVGGGGGGGGLGRRGLHCWSDRRGEEAQRGTGRVMTMGGHGGERGQDGEGVAANL